MNFVLKIIWGNSINYLGTLPMLLLIAQQVIFIIFSIIHHAAAHVPSGILSPQPTDDNQHRVEQFIRPHLRMSSYDATRNPAVGNIPTDTILDHQANSIRFGRVSHPMSIRSTKKSNIFEEVNPTDQSRKSDGNVPPLLNYPMFVEGVDSDNRFEKDNEDDNEDHHHQYHHQNRNDDSINMVRLNPSVLNLKRLRLPDHSIKSIHSKSLKAKNEDLIVINQPEIIPKTDGPDEVCFERESCRQKSDISSETPVTLERKFRQYILSVAMNHDETRITLWSVIVTFSISKVPRIEWNTIRRETDVQFTPRPSFLEIISKMRFHDMKSVCSYLLYHDLDVSKLLKNVPLNGPDNIEYSTHAIAEVSHLTFHFFPHLPLIVYTYPPKYSLSTPEPRSYSTRSGCNVSFNNTLSRHF